LLDDEDSKNNADFTESEDDIDENVIDVKNQAEYKISANSVMNASVKTGHQYNSLKS
jgi:hypothetical protein